MKKVTAETLLIHQMKEEGYHSEFAQEFLEALAARGGSVSVIIEKVPTERLLMKTQLSL